MKVVDVAQMRALEAGAETAGLPGPALMEIAGRAVADAVKALFDLSNRCRIVVLVGPGSNGGDGLVAARWLADAGLRPLVLTLAPRAAGDARIDLVVERGVPIVEVTDEWSSGAIDAALAGSGLIVDALLGTGPTRPLGPPMSRVLARAAATGAPIVAVDVPSGLDADAGRADPATPRCFATIALGAVKRGLVIGDGPERAGRIVPVGIGIPGRLTDELPLDVIDGTLLRGLLPERPVVGHKYSFGRVMVVAGSARYLGAPLLAALGAARAGAGLVTLASPRAVSGASAAGPFEITHLPLPGPADHLARVALEPLVEAAQGYDALVVGPGLGRESETADLLVGLLARLTAPCWVTDADALTLLSQRERWWELLPDDAVLTPHAAEMARLRGEPDVGVDRLRVALDSAKRWQTNVVLKGPCSIVARPDGRGAVTLAANPALATAGTGDVLAGIIAGLIAQGAAPFDAARAGVGLHAAAGELLARERGLAGGLASDLADLLPRAADMLRRGDQ